MSVRCRQSRACSTRHTSSYSPVILSWRPGILPSLRPTPTARRLFTYPYGRRGPSLRVALPPRPNPFYCQQLTSPPPPSSSGLGSPPKHYFESNPFCLLLNVINSQILKCPKSYFLLKHQPFLGHTNMKYTTIFDQPISFRTYLWQEV